METNELPNNARIVHDGNLRVVQFDDGRYGIAVMTREGFHLLQRMIESDQLLHFKTWWLDQYSPYMAIENEGPSLKLAGDLNAFV